MDDKIEISVLGLGYLFFKYYICNKSVPLWRYEMTFLQKGVIEIIFLD